MAEKGLSSLYEGDLFLWACRNARLLREGRVLEADLENIAGEIEDLGKEQEHGLQSQLGRLLLHLLKHQFQPSHRSRSWLGSMANARVEIDWFLEHNPSLRPRLNDLLGKAYTAALRETVAETGLPQEAFPDRCPFTFEQIMDDDFLPE